VSTDEPAEAIIVIRKSDLLAGMIFFRQHKVQSF
jgi:hypothetical protein